MISDSLPKGRDEGKDNIILNHTINSADLPLKSPSGKKVGLNTKVTPVL